VLIYAFNVLLVKNIWTKKKSPKSRTLPIEILPKLALTPINQRVLLKNNVHTNRLLSAYNGLLQKKRCSMAINLFFGKISDKMV